MPADAQLATRSAPPALPTTRPAPPRWAPVALLVLASVLFLGYGSRTITAPFGDAHDGRNAGVWASGSRSLREQGPVESRLGTRSPEIGRYANHPPLIYVETAVAETIGTAAPAATRAPGWLGSLAVIVLLARLLRDRGLHAGAVGVAVLLAATTPMFLVYGTMLDTPVTSLPLGVGLLLLWEQGRRGAPVRPWLAGGLAALAVLAGWQALLLALALGGWGLLRAARGTGRRQVNLAFPAGAGAGLVLLLAWLLWAFGGSLGPLADQFLTRTGQSSQSVGLVELLGGQRRTVLAMFGVVGVVAAGGLVVALRDTATRGIAALALGVTVPYVLAFRTGALNHDYWGYWFILAVAIGLAVLADRLVGYWRSRGRSTSAVMAAGAAVAVLGTYATWVGPPVGESLKVNGFEAAEVARSVSLDPAQEIVRYAGAVGEPASWLGLPTRRPTEALRSPGYAALAAAHPTDLVFVGEVRCLAGRNDKTYDWRPAASLPERPPVVTPC